MKDKVTSPNVSIFGSFIIGLQFYSGGFTGVVLCLCSAALERANMLINMKHGMARLDNVWGVGGGQRPVMFLISKVHTYTHTYMILTQEHTR